MTPDQIAHRLHQMAAAAHQDVIDDHGRPIYIIRAHVSWIDGLRQAAELIKAQQQTIADLRAAPSNQEATPS